MKLKIAQRALRRHAIVYIIVAFQLPNRFTVHVWSLSSFLIVDRGLKLKYTTYTSRRLFSFFTCGLNPKLRTLTSAVKVGLYRNRDFRK